MKAHEGIKDRYARLAGTMDERRPCAMASSEALTLWLGRDHGRGTGHGPRARPLTTFL